MVDFWIPVTNQFRLMSDLRLVLHGNYSIEKKHLCNILAKQLLWHSIEYPSFLEKEKK